MRPVLSIFAASLAASLIVDGAHAEGGYHPPPEMIRRSDFIAIIAIERVTSLPKIPHPRWSYGQRAHAVVERNIKGALPRAIDIYGDENFVCQQTELSPGRYVAFLMRGLRGRLHSSNYQMGIRPIRGDTVEWYYRGGDPLSPTYGYQFRWQRLDFLLRRITSAPRPNHSLQATAGRSDASD
jgi:hypothetical protein